MLKRICASLFVLGFSFSIPQTTFANDSEAETALGGLKLVQSKYISMDSEDLFISADLIKVSYKFTNNSDNDIQTTVSFPLPAIPYELGEYYEDVNLPDFETLDFKTIVNGKSVQYKKIITAEIKGKDITSELVKYKIPLDWDSEAYKYNIWYNKLSDAQNRGIKEKGFFKKRWRWWVDSGLVGAHQYCSATGFSGTKNHICGA
jgi:hypothetical protein